MTMPKTEQLTLDFVVASTWRRPEPKRCTSCSEPALANVYGFVWYQPRRAFVDAGNRRLACSTCLAAATEAVTTELRDQSDAYEVVWSHVPLAAGELPGEAAGSGWWVVEVKEPHRGEGRKR